MQVIREVPIDQIKIPPDRLTSTLSEEEFTALTESIRAQGLICPILLTPEGSDLILVSGLNRLRAYKTIGYTTIPAIITTADPTRAAILNITENLARGKTNPIEEALAIQAFGFQHSDSVEHLARLLNRPPSWINSRLDLLQLPEGLREVIQNGQLSMAAAKELSVIEDPHMLEYLVNQAIESGASAKTIHHWIAGMDLDKLNAALLTPSKDAPFPPSPPPIPTIDCFACGLGHQPHHLRPELLCDTCRAMLHPPLNHQQPGSSPS